MFRTLIRKHNWSSKLNKGIAAPKIEFKNEYQFAAAWAERGVAIRYVNVAQSNLVTNHEPLYYGAKKQFDALDIGVELELDIADFSR